MYKKLLILLFVFFIPHNVDAARLYSTISEIPLGAGSEFKIDIKIDSEEVSINAAQAEINFPNNLYEIIRINKNTSVFNFWVEEPTFSNETGVISFIGGTAKGISGESLGIFSIEAKAIGVGSRIQTFTNSVVTASDGRGTNVLSTIEDLEISIGSNTITPKIKELPIARPVIIDRPRVQAVDLPDKPNVTVSLYPDSDRWYSHTGETIALWEVPDDVIKVAIELDHSSNTEPPVAEEKLFNGKSFGSLSEGVWYLHIQFRNNIGWGTVTHYKISIDTTAPISFEIQTNGDITNDPTPEIRFNTQDSLSGVSEIAVLIDSRIVDVAIDTPITLPILPPGDHIVTVRVFDKAGNSVEDDVMFKILPLATPVINFVTKTVSENEPIFISGQSSDGNYVDINLCDNKCKTTFAESVQVNENGDWELFISETISNGVYTLTAVARDDRGATSYSTEDFLIKVKAKPVLSLGIIDLGWFELFLLLIVVVLSGSSLIGWNYTEEQRKRGAYAVITARDIKKFGILLDNDITSLEERLGKIEPELQNEMRTIIDKMKSSVSIIKKNIAKEIEKLQ